MSQNVCSFCGTYHQPERACPAAQQKGETMPKGEGQSLRFGGWTHSLEELDAICDVAISSPQNPDGSMQTNHVMNPQFYADVKRLVVAVRRFYEMDYREALSGQPTASAERGLLLLREHNYFYKEPYGNMKAGFYWCLCGWKGPDKMSYWKHLDALQSAPDSPLIIIEGQSDVVQSGVPSNAPPPEVSHYEYRAGRGYLEPVMQPSDAEQPKLSSNLQDNTLETNRKLHFALDTLRAELRELEAKWRSPEWAKAYMNDERPSEFICADELHAVIAPAPHPAEKD